MPAVCLASSLMVPGMVSYPSPRPVTPILRHETYVCNGPVSTLNHPRELPPYPSYRLPRSWNTKSDPGCNNIYLEDNSNLTGYESDGDVCDES